MFFLCFVAVNRAICCMDVDVANEAGLEGEEMSPTGYMDRFAVTPQAAGDLSMSEDGTLQVCLKPWF